MNKLINFLRKPKVWIYISIIYIWFYTFAKFIASIGPPLIIAKITDSNNSLSLVELNKALLTYIQEGAKETGINSQYILYSLMANIIILVPALVIGFFVLRKNIWAKNALILLLILLIFMPTLLSGFASELSLNILNTDTLIYLAMIYLFTRKSTNEYFLEKST